ncbi:MAG: hypothetical protein LBU50_07570 [Cellulomonas sp.]|jgi:hypothetical protein|nr:hypothetical protein [Cellulomonas sp.]
MHTSTVVAGAVHQLGDILRSRLRVQTTGARDASLLVLDDRSAVVVDRDSAGDGSAGDGGAGDGSAGDLIVTLWERLVPADAPGQRWSTPGYQTLAFSKTGVLPDRTWACAATVAQTDNVGVAVRAVVNAVRGQVSQTPPWRFACARGDVWDLTVGQPLPASCPTCGSDRIVRAEQAVRRPPAEQPPTAD